MKRDILKKILTAVIFAISTFLAWGGLIYATNDPDQFKTIGILVSFIGYAGFFRSVIWYENNSTI